MDEVETRYVALYPFLSRIIIMSTKIELMLLILIKYASVVWGQTAQINMAMLEVTQQMILRQIVNASWYIHLNISWFTKH